MSFQALKTWKESNDPDFEAKKNRILELYDIADGKALPAEADPTVVICMDEFGPLNLQPHPGKQWAAVSGTHAEAGRAPRRRRRDTYKRLHGVRHLLAAYDLFHRPPLWPREDQEGPHGVPGPLPLHPRLFAFQWGP